jgi:hypothetical protein
LRPTDGGRKIAAVLSQPAVARMTILRATLAVTLVLLLAAPLAGPPATGIPRVGLLVIGPPPDEHSGGRALRAGCADFGCVLLRLDRVIDP